MPAPKNPEISVDLNSLCQLAIKAGDVIMDYYENGYDVMRKEDKTLVTEADLAAETIIADGLRTLTPSWPIVAEEATAKNGAPIVQGDRFWLVDPLDGTKEFLSHNGEFTVNIGLIHNKKPVIGVIYAPALKALYFGSIGKGGFKMTGDNYDIASATPIHARIPPSHGHTLIVSRRHGDSEKQQRILAGYDIHERVNWGSSLKFCLIAEGKADIYPRFGRTMEWDTAAGQAILEAAGGRVTTLDGTVMGYHKQKDFANPSFLAWGCA